MWYNKQFYLNYVYYGIRHTIVNYWDFQSPNDLLCYEYTRESVNSQCGDGADEQIIQYAVAV